MLDKQKNIESTLSVIENYQDPIISIANAAFIEEEDSGKAPTAQEYKTVQDVSSKNPEVVFAVGEIMPTRKGNIFEADSSEIKIYPELTEGNLYVFDNNKTPVEIGYITNSKNDLNYMIGEVNENFNIENLSVEQINLIKDEFLVEFRKKIDTEEDNESEIPFCNKKR